LSQINRYVWHGFAAYAIWGTFPLYWVLLRGVPIAQVMGHRIVWSCLTLAALLAVTRRATTITSVSWKALGVYSVAAILIGVNWTVYVWAVTAGFVVETSLGYFITPLVNVLLGIAVLRERLRRLQWAAVALATAGVLHLTRVYGAPPWIALGLAASFGLYGLVKKRAPLPPVEGLFLETAALVGPALFYLVMVHQAGAGVFFADGRTAAILAGTGLLTVVPLLLFASAVRYVSLSAIGILQFISPTIQFLLGVFVLREPFSSAQLMGFALVWVAVAVFTADGVFARRQLPVLDEGAA
jgi:chloramphenicol-sensitive protein RarD